jgi:hypothetical protein
MSWAKRNLYFLISCIVAVVLLGAAGWYCYSEWQGNSQSWDALQQVYSQWKELVNKPITANEENIHAARDQVKQIKALNESLRQYLSPIPPIPNTAKLDDRALAPAIRDTIRQLRVDAGANITLPPDYAFSFSAQRDKTAYVPQSWGQLAQQLGEVKAICDILFSNRISSLDSIQRERTADDATATAQQPDYIDFVSVTNGNTVITPYQVAFRCFDSELGGVIASFANQPNGIMVRTLEVEPAEMAGTEMNGQPQFQPAPTFNSRNPHDMPMPTMPTPAAPAASPTPRATTGGLPIIVDENRLKVSMLLEVVKISPTLAR